MARTVKEWIGKNDDAMPPSSVRTRIFNNHQGVCHISGRKIQAGEPWDLDHIKALADGGENRETNLAPALKNKHQEKTAQENKDRAVVRRKASKHIGTFKSKSPMPKRHKEPKTSTKTLPPRRSLYSAVLKELNDGNKK